MPKFKNFSFFLVDKDIEDGFFGIEITHPHNENMYIYVEGNLNFSKGIKTDIIDDYYGNNYLVIDNLPELFEVEKITYSFCEDNPMTRKEFWRVIGPDAKDLITEIEYLVRDEFWELAQEISPYILSSEPDWDSLYDAKAEAAEARWESDLRSHDLW